MSLVAEANREVIEQHRTPSLKDEDKAWLRDVQERAISAEESVGEFVACKVEDGTNPGVYHNKFQTTCKVGGRLETRVLDNRFYWLFDHIGSKELRYAIVGPLDSESRTVLVEPAGEIEEEAFRVVASLESSVDAVLNGEFMFGVFRKFKRDKTFDTLQIRIKNAEENSIYYIDQNHQYLLGDSDKVSYKAFFAPEKEYESRKGVRNIFCYVMGIAPIDTPDSLYNSSHLLRRFNSLERNGHDIEILRDTYDRFGLVRSRILGKT